MSDAARLPGVDGLRGIAVLLVLVFHLWPEILPGGFLGVSVFFTISGFVIVRGLVIEREQSGRLDLRGFWVRRMRRLWPAATLTLVLVAVVWSVTERATRALGRDLLSSFLQVANWHQIAGEQEYGGGADSAVTHFWSLAVEEQLYLVVPLAIWIARGSRRTALAIFAALTGFSVLTTVAYSGDRAVVYLSTTTRAAELLLGGVLALATTSVRSGPAEVSVREGTLRARATGVAGLASLAVILLLARLTSLEDGVYYEGGLLGVAVLSTVLVGAAARTGWFARLLSARILTTSGRVSYGLYLYHWPVIVAFREWTEPSRLTPWVALAISWTLAALSLKFVEMPVRAGRWRTTSTRLVAALAASTVVILAVLGTRAPLRAWELDYDATKRRLGDLTALQWSDLERPSVAVFGDSTALMLAIGLAVNGSQIELIPGHFDLGCPIGRTGLRRGESPTVGDTKGASKHAISGSCDWTATWAGALRNSEGVDGALVLGGIWDLVGRKIPALGDDWLTLGDGRYDDWLRKEIAGAADQLRRSGARHVIWLTLPAPPEDWPNERFDTFNAMLADVAGEREWMTVLDYAGYLVSTGEVARILPDGRHLTEATSVEVARNWLTGELVRILGEDPQG